MGDRNRNVRTGGEQSVTISWKLSLKKLRANVFGRGIAHLDRTMRDKSYGEDNRLRDFLNYWDRFGFSTGRIPKLNLTLTRRRRRRSSRVGTISNWNSGEIMESRHPTLVS